LDGNYFIIIFDQNKINEDSIIYYMNNIHKYLEFKLTEEENKNINYLDLSIHKTTITYKYKFTENPHKQTLLYISHPTFY